MLFFFLVAVAFVFVIHKAVQSYKADSPTETKISTPAKISGRTTRYGAELRVKADEETENRIVRGMQALAEESGYDGSVQVLVPAGRRNKPNQLDIVTLPSPVLLLKQYEMAVVSARAIIDRVIYGLHVSPYPTATSDDQRWFHFYVVGPERDSGRPGLFWISDEFHWNGQRPFNPMLVKYALREWISRPEVIEAIANAKKQLPRSKRIEPPSR